MELHQLRYMTAVARLRHFSRAAEQCHVSQPSLSQQIAKLEDELGEPLFVRARRAVKLTPAGEVFLPRALRILEEVDHAKREAQDAGQLLRGVVNVGVLPTIAPFLLPGIIAAFSRQYPGVEIVVHEDTTAHLIQLAVEHEIDFAIASAPIADKRLEVRELFTEELLLAVPPGHPLARRRSVKTTDLETERFIVMQEGHCLGDQVLRFCERTAVHPHVSFRSAQLQSIQALVRAGLGISLIPAMAANKADPAAPIYRKLAPPVPQRSVTACWPHRRQPGRAAQALLQEAAAWKAGRTGAP